jgi:MoxR-like ATPase
MMYPTGASCNGEGLNNKEKHEMADEGTKELSLLRSYVDIKSRIVARAAEIKNILATLDAGRHLILEGAPGTTKSTILRTITEVCQIPFFLVEGNVDLTPAKLVGHFNPAKVIADDYKEEYFEKGPLAQAMEGGILYIEEFNRMPPDVANVLITAVEEGEVHVPRYGVVKAHPLFRVVCAQNPYDDVGTMRVSRAIYDRFCRIRLDYQSEEEEQEIVRRKTGCTDESLIKIAVRVTQETRFHKEIKQGASVRGAMDMVAIALRLKEAGERSAKEILVSAMQSAMSGKIWLQETTERTAETILKEILEEKVLGLYGMKWNPGGDGSPHDRRGGGQRRDNGPRGDEDQKRPAAGRAEARRQQEQQTVEDYWQAMARAQDQPLPPLQRMVRSAPEEVVSLLQSNRATALQILQSPEILELYGYIHDLLDPELREIARRYAGRLIVKLASQIANVGIKTGSLYRAKDDGGSDEIEIDATVDRITDNPTNRVEENLMFLARRSEQKACVVMLDHSYSMKGVKISMAALTAATIALHFKQDYGVVVFSTNAQVLKGINQYKAPTLMAEEILSLCPHGYTNIREALDMGIGEMEGYKKKIGILLTDGDWTCGGDPLHVARLFEKLHVIGLEEPESLDETHQDRISRQYYASRVQMIAREGRGHFSSVHNIDGVPLAITRCLTV